MTSKTLTTLLVGSHFRPPAKQILAALPSGASLRLVPEPENPYDEHAIAVYVEPSEIPESQHAKLDEELPLAGHDLVEILRGEALHLGYVAATGGKPLAGTDYAGNQEIGELGHTIGWTQLEATLGFAPDGRPLVLACTREGEPEA